ncbi:MAG: hypothetical protein M3N52_04830 [Actinomycetota bacterium]|nr:hypothetical protein [Actinomycetota bacterium]
MAAHHEPYVADPVEGPPLPRYPRLRVLALVMLVVVLVADLGYLAFKDRTTEDPSLGVPTEQTGPAERG